MAASIASVILQAGTERQSAESAMVMIHKAWSIFAGNADDSRKFADILDKHDQVIAETYARRSGKSVESFMALMKDESWFTGNEAKEAGLVDAIATPKGTNNLAAQSSLPSQPSPKGTSKADDFAASISASAVAVADGQLTAANSKPKTKEKHMSESTTPAVANPSADFTPVIASIDALAAKLDKITAAAPLPGAAPLTGSTVQNLGNPLVEKFNTLQYDVEARAKLVNTHHRDLRNQLVKHGVFNANTVDVTLVNTLTSATFLTTMRTKMAPLAAFARQVAVNPVSARQVINVNLLSSAGATQDNPTNFETGDTTSTAKAVTLAHVNRSFYTANSEQDLGLELAQKAPTNARIFAEGIMGKVTALMIAANYGAATVIGAAANFDATDLPAILALGKNYDRCTLLLDGGHLAYLLPTSRESFVYGEAGAYGFDGGIYKNNLWTGGVANIAGFVCGPDAIVWAAGAPAAGPAGNGLVSSTVTVPEIGLSVTSNTWYALASRSMWASYDVCFGCAVGDATQAENLVTA
jgi:hypothetical protein